MQVVVHPAEVVVNPRFMLFAELSQTCFQLERQFDNIPENRKQVLSQLSNYIQQQKDEDLPIRLVFVCTHNSRRSQFAQIWADVAANFYGIDDVEVYSAGTETTAFHPNAIAALRSQKFVIEQNDDSENPLYYVKFGTTEVSNCFSKTIQDSSIPKTNFAAIMTCSSADENCPFVPGCDLRLATPYEDPKHADDSPEQQEIYQKTSLEIARDCLYVFSQVF